MKFWVGNLLLFTLATTAYFGWNKNSTAFIFPAGCDVFGYVQMAQTIHDSRNNGTYPSFEIKTPQTQALIAALQGSKFPASRFSEFVAPHAHHYIEKSGKITCQYSPGTGWVLSWFKDYSGPQKLNEIIIIFFTLIGLFGGWSILRQGFIFQAFSWAALCITQILIAVMMGPRSYSINALLIPMFLAIDTARRGGFFFSFFSGVFSGLLVLIRPANLLLLPLPALMVGWKRWGGFSIGAFLGGGLPLLLHQYREAGGYLDPTYGVLDTGGTSFVHFWSHIKTYLWDRFDAYWAWVLCLGLISVLVTTLLKDFESHRQAKWGWIASAFLVLFGGFLFFGTHGQIVSYYLLPTYLAFSWAVIYAVAQIPLTVFASPFINGIWFIIFLVLPFAEIGGLAGHGPPAFKEPMQNIRPEGRDLESIPPELLDEHAWIWGDDTTGTFWYFAKKNAMKPAFADDEILTWSVKWIQKQPESRQFIVMDPSRMDHALEVVKKAGYKLVLRGQVFGRQYFEFVKKK